MTQYQSLKYVIVIKLSSHHHRLASCNEVQRNDSIFPIVIIRQYTVQWSWVEMDLWVVLCASVRTLVCVIMNWSPFLALWHCHTNTSLIMYQRLSELVIQIKPGPWVAVHFSFTQISNPPWLQAAPLVPHCAMQCAPFNALTVKHSHLHTHFRYKTPKQEFYEFHCGFDLN